MNFNKRIGGFTLIELLAVIAIMGILVSLILPNTLKAIHQGQNTGCLANIRSIDTAAMVCFSDARDWTKCSDQAQIQPYLPGGTAAGNWPVCPFNVPYDLELDPSGSGAYIVNPTEHFATYPTGDHVPAV